MQTKTLITSIAAVATIVFAGQARAQITINDTYLPPAEITRSDAPAGEPAEMTMNIADVSLEAPVYMDRSESGRRFTVVAVGLAARHHTFDLRFPGGDDEYFPKHLYGVGGSLSVRKSFGPKWYGVGFGSASVQSDFENVDRDHLVFEGGGFAVRRFGNLHVGIGPVFTYAFGEPLLIPAPYVRYEGSGKLSAEVKFPRHAKIKYAITDGFEVGAAARSLYSNYRLGDERAKDADGKSPVVVFSDLTAGIETSVRVFDPVWLTIGAGSTIRRKFTVNDDAGNELFDRGMKNGLVLSAGLETRL